MSEGTRLDTLYYDIELRTGKMDSQFDAARQKLRTLDGVAPKPIDVQVSTSGARENLERLRLGAVAAGAALLTIGVSAVRMADQLQLANGRLKLAVDGSDALAVAQTRLATIADATFQSYSETVDLYARFAVATKELNVSQADLASSTEAVATAVRLSGASSEAAKAGLIQFGQALSSGTLRGDELRSVLEQLPRLSRALADGLGVSVGELRKLGEAGSLTSDQLIRALLKELPKLRDEAAQLAPTLGQSVTLFGNAMARYVADANTATGATSTLAEIIRGAANNFDKIAATAAVAGAVFAGRVAPPILKALQSVGAEQVAQAKLALQAADARAEETRAALALARADAEATAAKVRDVAATREAIVLSRERALAERQAAQATIARAVPAAQLAPLGGAVASRELAAQAAAQATLARTTGELAQLGQQQTRVERELAAATAAKAAADGLAATATRAHGVAIAQTTIAARAGALAMRGFQGALALLGGPIGAAITAVLVGVSIAMDRQRERTEAARETLARYTAALDKMSEAQIRTRLGQLESERIGIIVGRQQLAPGDNAGQDRLSKQEAVIGEAMGILRGRLAGMQAEAAKASKAVGTDLAKAADLAEARLRILNTQGAHAERVFTAAAERWKDSTTANRSLAQALTENDAGAKALLADAERLVSADERRTAATKASTAASKADAKNARELAEAQKFVRESLDTLADRWANRTPVEKHTRAIDAWRDAAAEAKLPIDEIAAGVERLNAAVDEEGRQRLEELATTLAQLEADASGDALQQLEVTFSRQLAELDRRLAEARALEEAASARGDTAGASSASESVRRLQDLVRFTERQRDSLKEIEGLNRRAAEARRVESTFAKTADATYKGQAVTLADLRRIEADRLDIVRVLTERLADPTLDPKSRVAAQELLNQLTADQAEQQGAVATATTTAAGTTEALGAGLRTSAQAALALVQILGDGNSELARMLSGVVSLGSGLADLGAAAGKAGGFGKLFTSGAGLASALGPIAAIAGGAMAIFGSIRRASEEAKARAAELQKAAEAFTANLGKFVRDLAEQDAGEFDRARTALAERITKLVQDAAKSSGLDGAVYEGTRTNVVSLQALLGTVQARIGALQGQLADADAFEAIGLSLELTRLRTFADGLAKTIDVAGAAEAALTERQRERLAVATQDLEVRRLEASGQSEAAAALRDRLAAEREVQQAIVDYAGAEGAGAYVAALREVITLQQQAAAATRALSAAMRALDDLSTFFPELTGPDLNGLRATGARIWPEIFSTLFDGIDFSTREGLATAREQIRALYTQLAADGIDETERPLIDFLKRLFGDLGAAIESLGDPIQQAIEAFGVQADTFGFSAAQRFQGIGALLKTNTPGLSAILGDAFQSDILTADGRAGLIARLKQGISDIVGDGQITEAEKPLLAALQQLLGFAVQAVDDATTQANAASDQIKNTRATNAQLDIALGDQQGADAFRTNLEKFGPAFASLFDTLNLDTLAGIETARQGFAAIRKDLDGLTDAQLLEKFGLTREQIVEALLEVDTGLDGLAGTLKTLAQQSVDFVTSLTNDWLEATGHGMDVQLAAVDAWVDQMVSEAERLGVATAENLNMINQVADSRRAKIRESAAGTTTTAAAVGGASPARNYTITGGVTLEDLAKMTPAERAAYYESAAIQQLAGGVNTGQVQAMPVPDTTAPTQPTERDSFVASDITRSSETAVLRMTDYLASGLVEWRGTRVATEGLVALLGRVSLPAPELSVPALGSSGGGLGAARVGGGITLNININGPVSGTSALDVARQLAEAAVPYINEALARAAGIEARSAGRPSLG